jgi:hypothetical protein
MRAVAAQGGMSYGTIQFHFRNQRDFTTEVLRFWGSELSVALHRAADGALGLMRTWKLSECWVGLPDARLIGGAGNAVRSPAGLRDCVSAALIELMQGWVDETVRSIEQARLRGELKRDVDIEATGVNVHRLLWSHSWSAAVCGAQESAQGILTTVWQLLYVIAANPATTLPPRPRAIEAPRPSRSSASRFGNGPPPDWTWALERSDPRYYAFERHEIMGEPRSFLHPPEVLAEDVQAAERYCLENGVTRSESSDEPRVPRSLEIFEDGCREDQAPT